MVAAELVAALRRDVRLGEKTFLILEKGKTGLGKGKGKGKGISGLSLEAQVSPAHRRRKQQLGISREAFFIYS